MLPNITDAEERVLRALWGHSPSPLRDVVSRLKNNWSSKTVKTLLDRMSEKGAVGVERGERHNRYYALIGRDAFAASELNRLADRLFDGAAQDMMAFFCRSRPLTSEQTRELIALLEEAEK